MPHLESVSLEEPPSSSEQIICARRSRTFSGSLSRPRRLSAYVSIPRLRDSTTGLPSPPHSDSDEQISRKRLIRKDSGIGLNSPPNSDSEDLPSFVHERREVESVSSCSPSHSNTEDGVFADLRKRKESDSFPFPVQCTAHPRFSSSAPSGDWKGAEVSRRGFSIGSHSLPIFADRYITDRDTSQSPFETFRVSKSPNKLSVIEKLLRQKSATPDPFAPSRAAHSLGRAFPALDVRNGNRVRPLGVSGTSVLGVPRDGPSIESRAASIGAVWNVGGNIATTSLGPVQGIPDGRGGMLGSGTNAPMYTSNFLKGRLNEQEQDCFEGRLAAALDIDQTRRMFNSSQSPEYGGRTSSSPDKTQQRLPYRDTRTKWKDGEWIREGSPLLLDAPLLRDDYYCSVLAYCHTARTLAVGLSNRVYLWSEAFGVQHAHLQENSARDTYVSSLSFSSSDGGHNILAIGRNSGLLSLWSLHDSGLPRFQNHLASSVACVAFKPVVTRKISQRFGSLVSVEELLVGDESGIVHYYSVEWMSSQDIEIHGWPGALNLMARIIVHSQQICGLAWSREGDYFATGANDNLCCLFEVKDIFRSPEQKLSIKSPRREPLQTVPRNGLPNAPRSSAKVAVESDDLHDPELDYVQNLQGDIGSTDTSNALTITGGQERHRWVHSAAIKAIAFCPWQRGLVATGGGSNDRAIHFYHTFSSACLATIDVQAQVTSLIWSTSRREIAATFGYAQPEHPYRIAVFSWPSCEQVVAIPWTTDARALLAIPYPGGPNETSQQSGEGETWWSRTAEEGCIVVACSDESVKFHEVWSGSKRTTGGHMGLLGGSHILEGLAGIEREGAYPIR
ncbi:hypothetical protein MMC07_003350 [Pseudocyphellaria aurata]|nr:hypothetical protein [Pseudocyphellaria aurata]